jgi:hypothetical protein
MSQPHPVAGVIPDILIIRAAMLLPYIETRQQFWTVSALETGDATHSVTHYPIGGYSWL